MTDNTLAALLATLNPDTHCLHPPTQSGVPYLPCGRPLRGGGFMRGRCPVHGAVRWIQEALKVCWEERLAQAAQRDQRLTDAAVHIAEALEARYGIAIDWHHLKALLVDYNLQPKEDTSMSPDDKTWTESTSYAYGTSECWKALPGHIAAQ